MKLNLQDTDYDKFLQNESGTLSPGVIRDRALDKLVSEFQYLRSQCVGPLAKFLDYIVIDYMIDNVMLILKATMNNPNVNLENLVAQRHPMGEFEPSTLKAICSFQNNSKGYEDLYQTVLIDTPIGPYFQQFLKELAESNSNSSGSAMGANDVRNVLEEMPTTKLENTLRKLYLEDFYNFCKYEIGGDTAEIMCELLRARADAIAINITLNSFGSSLNDETGLSDRALLYPSIGHLYPAGTRLLSEVRTEETLVEALRGYKEYSEVLEKYVNGESTIDDAFYAREVMLCETAFEGQFNYAPFYAFVRLKEQEIRNLVWACETIVQKQKSKMAQHFIPIFSKTAPWRADGKKTGATGVRQ